MIDAIIHWGKKDANIQALVLTGSRATQKDVDEYSDYDICVFSKNPDKYIRNDDWMSLISKVYLWIADSIQWKNQTVPTRLVLFEKGIKVDFTLFCANILSAISSLPDEWNMGYKVLLDKNNYTEKLPKASFKGFIIKRPTEYEFFDLLKEFWFEVYEIRKYLKREDLWPVKFRMNHIQQNLLLQLIQWHELGIHGNSCSLDKTGKRMQEKIEKATWDKLYGIFAHFDSKDSLLSLRNLIALFTELSKEIAKAFDFVYPKSFDNSPYKKQIKSDIL